MVKDFLARTPAPSKVEKTLQTPASSTATVDPGNDVDLDSDAKLEPNAAELEGEPTPDSSQEEPATPDVVVDRPSYIDLERHASASASAFASPDGDSSKAPKASDKARAGRMVDVVLSDMSEPWPQTYGFWLNTLSNPYNRMMNTSGNAFRDHAGSMDLCLAALEFASDTLRPGGHFVCKFYQGGEDKALENRLKKMFNKVVREKPESSRSVSGVHIHDDEYSDFLRWAYAN